MYFLSAKEAAGRIIDDAQGGFFERLTLLDIELRLGRKLESEDLRKEQMNFKEFVRDCVADWTDKEKQTLLSTMKSAHSKCSAAIPSLIPKKWEFIKTNGQEVGAPYTRGSCIVFPQSAVDAGLDEKTIIHETFHIYSRLNPAKRAELYQAIGFERLGGVVLPTSLDTKRLTNPDGADFGYGIDVKDRDGRTLKVIPVVFSRHKGLRKNLKGLFNYIDFALFEVINRDGLWIVATDADGKPQPLLPFGVGGFFEQIGRNTNYIIHPDEILADNVAMLALAGSNDSSASVRSPKVLARIERVFKAK